jgi:hypothetical protein
MVDDQQELIGPKEIKKKKQPLVLKYPSEKRKRIIMAPKIKSSVAKRGERNSKFFTIQCSNNVTRTKSLHFEMLKGKKSANIKK